MAALAGIVTWFGEAPSRSVLDAAMRRQERYSAGRSTTISAPRATFACGGGTTAHLLARDGWFVCADARIDNLADLRRALQALPSASMAELLLAAWERWGPECLNRIVGDLALAVYHESTRQLWLARDPTGQRPLFFHRDGQSVSLASIPSAVAAAARRRLVPDLRHIAAMLAESPPADGSTNYEGISTVLPGEVARIYADGCARERYWNPSLDSGQGRNDASLVEEYRTLLAEAVRCRMDRGGVTATQLSSGWDSSAVTTTAAMLREGPAQVIAFTAAPLPHFRGTPPRGRIADESGLAAQTARRYGLRHIVLREAPPLFEAVRAQTLASQAPVLSPHNIAWWTEIGRQARVAGASVLLTGELGNLGLNAGGLSTLAALAAEGQFLRLLHEGVAAGQRPDVRWRGVLINAFGPWLPDLAWHGLRARFLGFPEPGESSFIRPEWQPPELSRRPSGNPAADRLAALRVSDPGMLRMAAIYLGGPPEHDVMSDRRLIEFGLRLPSEQLLRHGRSRPLARTALSDRVPAEVLDSPVRGLQAADWYLRSGRDEAYQLFEEISAAPCVDDLLDLPALRTAIREWPTSSLDSEAVTARYRFAVTNALTTGLFLAMLADGALEE